MKKYFLSSLIFLIQLIAINAQRSCPVGWILNEQYGSCYKIGVAVLARNWYQARVACQSFGAELASIKDTGDRDYLVEFVNNNQNKEFWLGGYRRLSDSAWVWTELNDGPSSQNYIKVPTQVNWDSGKPDSTSGDCLQLAKNGSFSNKNCNDPKAYICKRPMGISTSCNVDDFWEPVNGTCIKVFEAKFSYDDSRSQCQNRGGDLVVVKNEQIQIFLSDWYKIHKTALWIGLSDKNGNDGILHWVDDHFSIPFQYWAPGQPYFINGNYSTVGNCTVINDLKDGLWSIDYCSNQYYFACQKPQGQCAEGWIPFKNKCYLINSSRQKYTSWIQAESTCKNYGGGILTIKDNYEQRFIAREIKNTFSNFDFWLGLSDFRPIDQFIWSPGDEKVENFTNWLSEQPVMVQDRDNCGIISVSLSGWYTTSNCFQKLPYVCQIDLDAQVIPHPSNINTYGGNSDGKPCVFPFVFEGNVYYECGKYGDRNQEWCATTTNYDSDQKWGFCSNEYICENGWIEADSLCYKLFKSTSGLTFDEANNICYSNNGLLAKIAGPKSQTMIDDFLFGGENAWIGLKNSGQSNFVWVDNTPLNNFENWRHKHPNMTNYGACVVIDTSNSYLGEWMTVDCNSKFSNYICQQQPKGLVLPTQPSLTTTTYSQKCGRDWIERPFSNFCYQFVSSFEAFDKAEQLCQIKGGSLVSILSVDEQIFIQNYIGTLNFDTFWLGANRESSRKGWSWIDGIYPFIFTNWALGEYNTGNNQFCAVISNQLNGQWKTIECDNRFGNIKFPFICKKKSQEITTTKPYSPTSIQPGFNLGCENNWSYYSSNCYKYYNSISDHKTFDEAKEFCKSEKSDLTEIFNEEENEFLVSMMQMRRIGKLGKNFGCPSGWNLSTVENSCYQLVSVSTSDWNKAQSYCQTFGGYVAALKSKQELEFIADL
ncbi:macrophage mannose receptor 1-like, partial [Brachionus plicatilis]